MTSFLNADNGGAHCGDEFTRGSVAVEIGGGMSESAETRGPLAGELESDSALRGGSKGYRQEILDALDS